MNIEITRELRLSGLFVVPLVLVFVGFEMAISGNSRIWMMVIPTVASAIQSIIAMLLSSFIAKTPRASRFVFVTGFVLAALVYTLALAFATGSTGDSYLRQILLMNAAQAGIPALLAACLAMVVCRQSAA